MLIKKTNAWLLCMISICMLATTVVKADTPTAIPLATRTVVIFTQLENQLKNSLMQGKHTEVEKLLADDFEERTATKPRIPIPRQDWLAHMLSRGKNSQASHIEQMSVRDLGNIMVVNFKETNANAQNYFIVDIWQGKAMQWQLAARYIANIP